MEETRPNEFMPVYEGEKGSYLYNSKDLCMIEHIPELIKAGVTSFKIEGRAKTAYYTAVITNAYRTAINGNCSDWVKNEVNCVSHRPYCTGFYLGEYDNLQSYDNSGYIRDCDFVGVVESSDTIIQRNYFTTDDYLEVISPGQPPERLVIEEMYNSNDELITVANHAVEVLRIKCAGEREFTKGSMVRRVNSPPEEVI